MVFAQGRGDSPYVCSAVCVLNDTRCIQVAAIMAEVRTTRLRPFWSRLVD